MKICYQIASLFLCCVEYCTCVRDIHDRIKEDFDLLIKYDSWSTLSFAHPFIPSFLPIINTQYIGCICDLKQVNILLSSLIQDDNWQIFFYIQYTIFSHHLLKFIHYVRTCKWDKSNRCDSTDVTIN